VEKLTLDGTIRSTAGNGYLDVKTWPERHSVLKVLLLLDADGSMETHIKVVEKSFSAVGTEFQHLVYYYFHNCLCEEGAWYDNQRRWHA